MVCSLLTIQKPLTNWKFPWLVSLLLGVDRRVAQVEESAGKLWPSVLGNPLCCQGPTAHWMFQGCGTGVSSVSCVCVGNNCGKAHKLLTGAIENDKVAGDNFHYKLPLLLLAVGDGCQPHNRKMRWFLGGDFSIGLKLSATLRLFGKKVSDVRWLLWSLDMEVKNCGLNSIPILKATLPGQK